MYFSGIDHGQFLIEKETRLD